MSRNHKMKRGKYRHHTAFKKMGHKREMPQKLTKGRTKGVMESGDKLTRLLESQNGDLCVQLNFMFSTMTSEAPKLQKWLAALQDERPGVEQ